MRGQHLVGDGGSGDRRDDLTQRPRGSRDSGPEKYGFSAPLRSLREIVSAASSSSAWVQSQRGMTLIELLIVIIILGILLTVAVAALFRARVSSNEASAIAGLRAVYSAQFAYTAGCGRGNYATNLTDLTIPPPGGTEGYLSPDLGGSNNPERNGYRFNVRPAPGGMAGLADCHGSPTQTVGRRWAWRMARVTGLASCASST